MMSQSKSNKMQPTLKQWVFSLINVAVTNTHGTRTKLTALRKFHQLIYLSIVEVEVAVGDNVIIH
jgi:hypothetical protein